MVNKIFFQSSLPRSGSTLLQNIMGQNPDIYVTPTSGLMELIYGARYNYTESIEFKAHNDQELMRKGFLAFCNSGIHAFASAVTDKPYYIDKGRSWGIHYDWLETFMPYKPKIICMIRDLRDVFASMENAFRKNPEKHKLIDWMTLKNNTIPKRIDYWSTNMPVGTAVERLQAMIETNVATKILFVKFEDLCLRPDVEISRVYNFLELPFFQHDYDNIQQITIEDDKFHEGWADHTIRQRLEMPPSRAKDLLGDAICDWIYNRYKWYFDYFKYIK